MKSTGKYITEYRKSISKRNHASNKGFAPSNSTRKPQERNVVLTKSQTLRLLSATSTKVNNFMHPPLDLQKIAFTARQVPKKKPFKIVPKNQHQQLLLKKSDKMKLIFWNQDPSLHQLKPLAVSADFIVNQQAFWQKSEEPKLLDSKAGKMFNQSMVKEWKQLHKNSFIIWIVRNHCVWNKVQLAINSLGLPLHAVFAVKKKNNYTVDYSNVVKELERQRDQSSMLMSQNRSITLRASQIAMQEALTIFETVKVNLKDVAVYQSYRSKIPVLLGKKAKVILMRMEGEPPGLDPIIRCIQKWKKAETAVQGQPLSTYRCRQVLNTTRRRAPQLFLCPAIKNFIHRYLSQRHRQEWEQHQRQQQGPEQDWFYEQQQIQDLMEASKRRIIDKLISDHGRSFQFEGGLSIYNFVGEMLKRNHKVIFSQMVESLYISQRKKPKKVEWLQESSDNKVDLRVEYFQMEQL